MRRGWHLTASGGKFDLLDPHPDDVFLEDIAHALAYQCRYGGHTSRHYSVAEHGVRLARYLWIQGWDETAQKVALLHDAEEAYLRDLPAPFLASLPPDDVLLRSISAIGVQIRQVVFRALGVPAELAHYERRLPALADLDQRIRADEIAHLFPASSAWAYEGLEPLGVFYRGERTWGQRDARDIFLDEARRLGIGA